MNRYLILEDGAADFNQTTLHQLERDKADGWAVSALTAARIVLAPDGSVRESTDPAQGLRAAKIVLA
jgi:hypothetical protein